MKWRLDRVTSVLTRTEVRYLVVAGSVSPQNRNSLSLGSKDSSKARSARHKSANDGVLTPLYGLYHGLLLVANDVYEKKSRLFAYRHHIAYRLVAIALTFQLVMFGFLLFSGHILAI